MRHALVLALTLTISCSLFAREPMRAQHAMVASMSPLASQAGAEVMKRGGNAVDGAVATAFALAVTWPSAGNLGGGGFMLLRTADGKVEAIDYRETAPLASTKTMYLDAAGNVVPGLSMQGGRASGVPGAVAGLAFVHKRYGRLPWRDVVEPARKLAAEGFVVNFFLARSLRDEDTIAKMKPFPESQRIFQRNGHYFEAGDTIVQPELGRTLARIQKDPRDFYEGETAKLLLAEMKRGNGIVTAEDLRTYQPKIREPLRGMYRGYEVITMPPPSSGGSTLLSMLAMLERHDLRAYGFQSARYVHTLVEVMRRAFADRAEHLGDTDFVKVPLEGLMSKKYLMDRAATIDPLRATPSRDVRAGNPSGYESPETTHFTVIDGDGMVVSNTYTLNDGYGSGATVPGAGFLLNNEMDDFTSRPGVPNAYGLLQGEANSIAPGKRPLSSMTPTIVVKDGKVAFAIGSPGGPTIINTVLQVILNIVDFDMSIQEAIDAPRVHHQWMPDEIQWERNGMNPDTRMILQSMGHVFRAKSGMAGTRYGFIGDAQGIAVDEKGLRLGASDWRLGGIPAGW
jgi:gamma-glutamyltranspeptidase / glutathione hydrolase